jgi:nicotinate dehydrogenase subunit A
VDERIALTVNGRAHALAVPRDAPLLNVLRNDLGLNGPKYGCGLGECGACTVLIDGIEARACVIPVGGVAGRAITTLEGLGTPAAPHPVQQAFIECQAAQCGYCLNGMIVSTVALLGRIPRPTPAQVRAALAHNLCRCGAHLEILQAVQRAAALMAATTERRAAESSTAFTTESATEATRPAAEPAFEPLAEDTAARCHAAPIRA